MVHVIYLSVLNFTVFILINYLCKTLTETENSQSCFSRLYLFKGNDSSTFKVSSLFFEFVTEIIIGKNDTKNDINRSIIHFIN